MALPSPFTEWVHARTWSPGVALPSAPTSWANTRTWADLLIAPSPATPWVEARTWTATAYRLLSVDADGEQEWVPMGEMALVT